MVSLNLILLSIISKAVGNSCAFERKYFYVKSHEFSQDFMIFENFYLVNIPVT